MFAVLPLGVSLKIIKELKRCQILNGDIRKQGGIVGVRMTVSPLPDFPNVLIVMKPKLHTRRARIAGITAGAKPSLLMKRPSGRGDSLPQMAAF